LLALTMNGALLPPEHGAPLRAVVPGWYAMDSVKWLVRIEVVSRAFRGPFQELDYRFQPAGQDGPGERLAALPVHALVVSPAEGDRVRAGRLLASGIAWSAAALDSVAVSLDGQAWQPARLGTVRPYQRALWELALEVPPGRHTLAVRATDVTGARQPDHPLWNKRGYANHSIHRVGFRAG
jgi:DMSO/TMAO reductase YedYZ molybdopterin-dependent catalytic subunit